MDTLNSLVKDTEHEGTTLYELIKNADGAVFNNAAQIYNHDFYWKGLNPNSTKPSVELKQMIERDFGSMEAFKTTFLDAAATLFGAGWAWLSIDKNGKLLVEKSANANNPIRSGRVPLLTSDVWEHAYYIDYRNARPKYLDAWWELVNWRFVSENLAGYKTTHERYIQPCNENDPVCGYVDIMQEHETVAT